MSRPPIRRVFACDFETTVYKGQVNTEVWASASVELNTEQVEVFHSIEEQYEYFKSLDCNIIAYYHNLKFDGSFWLSYLLVDLELEQAYEQLDDTGVNVEWLPQREMKNNTFRYSITDRGQWYTILIKVNNHFIEIRDSLKLLPFSLAQIGKSFGTQHKKLEMEYTGFRYAGCEITPHEKEYLCNDVLVLKEALEIMLENGHSKLTIGACCLQEYKNVLKKSVGETFDELYPLMTEYHLNPDTFTQDNADSWIRKSYKGGWCYLVKGKEGKVFHNGSTADVNSLYPSVMSSESGNRYPTGLPKFWNGDMIPDEALKNERYYFIRVRTRFYLKPNMLPFVQIKGNLLYKGTECLESTDVYDEKTDRYYSEYKTRTGTHDTRVELTLTMTDYKLLKEHYNLVDFEIIQGCYFETQIGIFDKYIEKYKKIKLESTGALRELAKLFLNNLYGKMATSTDSSFKIAFVKPDKTLGFYPVSSKNKTPVYIPVGSAITSYARDFTIRTAQKNYNGKDKAGFIYADTDSIHCDVPIKELKGLTVHEHNFCCWKIECEWDDAIYTRQKTYIEHIVSIPNKEIKHPYYDIKCAGMPQKCKNLFELSMKGFDMKDKDKYTETEVKFLSTKRTISDFKVGLSVTGKLMPKRIRGGILLVDTTYEMR